MSGIDPNGGSAVVVPGAGATGPAGPAPSGTGLVSVTAGVLDTPSTLAARVAADAAALRAILDATRVTTYTFADATGVTLVNGNGTAAVTGGQLVLTTASGADTTTPNAPTATVALPSGTDPAQGLDVSVNLVNATGTLGTTANRSWLSISNLADSKNITPSTGDVIVYLFAAPDGSLSIADASGGAGSTRTTTAAGVLLYDGQDWWRVVIRGTQYTVLTGRGVAGARPTTWTHRYTGTIGGAATLTTTLSQMAYVTLSGYRNGSQAQAHVVTFDGLQIVRLP